MKSNTFQLQPDQLPPEGDWHIWTLIADRAAGKTRAALEWLWAEASDIPDSHWAIVAPSQALTMCALEICVETWRHRYVAPVRHDWRQIRLSNGATIHAVPIHSIHLLRGLELNGAVLDEVGFWPTSEPWQDLSAIVRRDPAKIVATVHDFRPPMIQAMHGRGYGIETIVEVGNDNF